MSEVTNIKLDLGDGLHTNSEDKLDVFYEQNGNMHTETSEDPIEIGLYVEDLNGVDGGGSSAADGWTTTPATGWSISNPAQTIPNFLDVNRDVVNLIFTFGLYKSTVRHPTSIAYGTEVKDVRSLCNEIVAPIHFNPPSYTSYRPNPGEIIQLVRNPTFRTVPYGTGTIACENGNRLANDTMETIVMLVIMEAHYMSDIQQGGNAYWINDMTVCCIYSSIPEFIVGQTYSGTQLFDANHI